MYVVTNFAGPKYYRCMPAVCYSCDDQAMTMAKVTDY